MSYEGYDQYLCEEGHYWIAESYYEDDDNCYDCNKPAVWRNAVDCTNGIDPKTGNGYGYVELEQNKSAEYEECFHCKHRKMIKAPTYVIPKPLNKY